MPLSPPASGRTLKHTRSIQVAAFARDDGLWDLDARITDIKTRDMPLAAGTVRLANTPVHDLWLRLTVDTQLTILDAEAVSDAVPYPGFCDTIGPAYKRLIGLNLLKGFRRQAAERLGGVLGCTHLSELAQVLPTAAIQAFAGDVFDTSGNDEREVKPFQLDRCHALRTDGAAVAQYYPRWAVRAAAESEPG